MELFSALTRRDPYPLYDHLREASPVLHVPALDLWAVFGHDAVRRVLSDHEAFSSNVAPSRGITFQWLLFMDPPRPRPPRASSRPPSPRRPPAPPDPPTRPPARELIAGIPSQWLLFMAPPRHS